MRSKTLSDIQLADLVRRLMHDQGITQTAAAERVGVSQAAVWQAITPTAKKFAHLKKLRRQMVRALSDMDVEVERALKEDGEDYTVAEKNVVVTPPPPDSA